MLGSSGWCETAPSTYVAVAQVNHQHKNADEDNSLCCTIVVLSCCIIRVQNVHYSNNRQFPSQTVLPTSNRTPHRCTLLPTIIPLEPPTPPSPTWCARSKPRRPALVDPHPAKAQILTFSSAGVGQLRVVRSMDETVVLRRLALQKGLLYQTIPECRLPGSLLCGSSWRIDWRFCCCLSSYWMYNTTACILVDFSFYRCSLYDSCLILFDLLFTSCWRMKQQWFHTRVCAGFRTVVD